MKEELYKKVYIKTEADLPKDTGKHFIHIPINDEVYSVHLGTIISQWKRIDWYLQPLAQPELIVPSEEEIKQACPQSIIHRISCWIQGAKWAIEQIKKLNKLNK